MHDIKKEKKKHNFYYSFLTVILVFILFYTSISAVNNVVKLVSFHHKLKVIEKAYAKAEINNKALKIMLTQSLADIQEEIERNRLKRIPKDELMVNIISKEEEAKEENLKGNNKFAKMY